MAGAFSLDLGASQGRIQSTHAADGSYVYELGHASRIATRLNTGDYHEIKQDIVIDPEAKFIRAQIYIYPPTTSDSYSWKLTARLNGVVRASRVIINNGLAKTITDFTIPLALANTPPTTNEIAFRLELLP